MNIQTLGIDIAKNVFQLHGVNRSGHVVLKRRVMRDQLLAALAQINPCTVVVEACTGAFYWARKCEALGHQVKIISPQYVKPFVRRQKNDGNDAEAICTAARQARAPARANQPRSTWASHLPCASTPSWRVALRCSLICLSFARIRLRAGVLPSTKPPPLRRVAQ